MNFKFLESNRKGQSAIEYLTTYGWALLAIVVVGAFLMQMGVFSQCSKTNPRFTGQNFDIDDWTYLSTGQVAIDFQGVQDTTNITQVELVFDSGETWTNSSLNSFTVSTGSTTTILVSGTALSAGQCGSAQVSVSYDFSGQTGEATADGRLRGAAPA